MSRSSIPKHSSSSSHTATRESAAFDPAMFLETSKVSTHLESIFQCLLQFRPADPIVFLRDHLRALAKVSCDARSPLG